MSSLNTEIIGLGVLALLIGAWRGWVRRHDAWSERLAEALIPLLLAGTVFVFHETLELGTRWVWSACRLGPALAWWHGFPLYSPSDSGLINGWLYGPVAPIFWAPAGLAGSPQAALTIAMAINLAGLLLPLFIAGVRHGGEPGKPGLLGFIFGSTVLLQIYPTWYMASTLSVDAIAAGFGAGSCLVLLGPGTPDGKRLALAAVLAALAAWTKQIEAPLCLAQIGWLWFCRGRGPALRYTAACAGAQLVMIALVCASLEPRDVLYNMWTIPSAHALVGGWPAAWVELADFGRYTAIFWLPGLLAFGLAGKSGPAATGANLAGRDGLLLPLAAAAVLLPAGIMAVIKIGGDRNSIHSVYYLALAAILALPHCWSPAVRFPVGLRRTAVLLAAAVATLCAIRQVTGYPGLGMLPRRCLSEEAWNFAREHPGRTYFPWDPLATLFAEGRIYSFEYGVLDRIYARQTPPKDLIRHALPAELDTVIYPRADYSRIMVKDYLPEFTREEATADWLIYRRQPARDGLHRDSR